MLEQEHLCSTDDLIGEPPSPRQNYNPDHDSSECRHRYFSGASFSSSDAEDSTMLSEVWGTQQLQRSCRAESFVTK